MDPAFRETVNRGSELLGIEIPAAALQLLERYADRLLAWNRKVNLTSITGPAEVAEKHVLDSLLVARTLGAAGSLLDVGSGAGLPGIPLACLRPHLEVVCCDSVAKKIAFVKAVSAELGLARVRGVVARAEGSPEREGLPRAEVVISRALAEPEIWVPLGRAYLAPGGALVAMLGRLDDEARLSRLGAASGLVLSGVERHELPFSRSARAIARWVIAGGAG